MSGLSILSFDFGTSGVKVVLVSDSGEVKACETENYKLYVPRIGFAEQDANEYWDALVRCIRRILKDEQTKKSVGGISLCTQWKGMIPLDRDGNVLHNNIIWMDARAVEQAGKMNEEFNTDFFVAQNYWARLRWCSENLPDIYPKAKSILEVNSFIKWKLTGEMAADISNDFIHSCDREIDSFYAKATASSGLDRSQFPRFSLCTDMVGKVNSKASETTGIPEGTPVFSGSGDIPAIAIGSGCQGVGDHHAYFGTSGWIGAVVDHSYDSIFKSSSLFTPERDIILVQTMQSIGSSFNWAISQLYKEEQKRLGDGVFDLINEEVSDVPAGSEGLLSTPWVAGEIAPLTDKARAVFIGMGLNHDRRHMINAMMEGICYTLKNKFYEGLSVPCLSVVGGGANSDHWMQMLSDVLQTEISIPCNNRHAGAIGAAVYALVGLGCYSSLDEAKAFVKEKKHFYPDSSKALLYNDMYRLFRGLYPSLESTFYGLRDLSVK